MEPGDDATSHLLRGGVQSTAMVVAVVIRGTASHDF